MSKIKLALDIVSDLKGLAESIEALVQAMEPNEIAPIDEANEEPTKKKSKAKAKVEEPEIEEPQAEEVTEQKQPTLEEVRAAMADKSRDGHREGVKAILTNHGVNNLSALDPKHYAAAIKEVGELK
jgi:hypothetical protein